MSNLHRLSGKGDPYELLAALQAGADKDERNEAGRTPLMEAAKRDRRPAERLLLRWGANVDAVDEDGHTALLDAKGPDMRRDLLDAGANPDAGRIAGMTLLALMVSFRDRPTVDILLAHGASPDERTREGRTVREILDDPTTDWGPPVWPDGPERRTKVPEEVRRHGENLTITPERFVAAHRDILIWSYGAFSYDDPALGAWAARVSDLLADPEGLETVYRAHLSGEELDAALRPLVRARRRAEREAARQRRHDEFEARFLP